MTQNRLQWHRLAGLVMTPLFDLLGYRTLLEVDLAMQSQIADIITVHKESGAPFAPTLPKIYWEAFEELNQHNLITFKSYSESFNVDALEEFYGHLTNYRKINKLNREQINLYAVVYHYPDDILKDLSGTKYLQIVKEKEIFDLSLGALKRVRIIICRETTNPVLGLFSGDYERVSASYSRLRQESALLNGVSTYLNRLTEYYGEEFLNMYTEKDFFRDYPLKEFPFAFPWEVEFHKQAVQKALQEKDRKTAQQMRSMGFDLSLITQITGLTEQEILALDLLPDPQPDQVAEVSGKATKKQKSRGRKNVS